MSRRISILAVLLLASAAFAQVDTLFFTQIERRVMPGDLSNSEIKLIDVNNDSTEEIAFAVNNLIYIYCYASDDYIWISSGFDNTRPGFQFADMNNDGYQDIIVNDYEINIHVIDFHNGQNIWTGPSPNTGPPPDFQHNNYAIGDRNGDGFMDLAISNRVYSDNSSDYDTVKIEFFNGPFFDPCDTLIIPMIDNVNPYGGEREIVRKLIIDSISDGLSNIPSIIIFTRYDYIYRIFDYEISGLCHVYNGNNLNIGHSAFVDCMLYESLTEQSGLKSIGAICSNVRSNYNQPPQFLFDYYSIYKIGYQHIAHMADIYEIELWYQYPDIPSVRYDVGNYAGDNGLELCVYLPRGYYPNGPESDIDSLGLFTFPEFEQIWKVQQQTAFNLFDQRPSIFLLDCPEIFAGAKIFTGNSLYNMEDGIYEAYCTLSSNYFRGLADFNNDNLKEFYRIRVDTLILYGVQYVTFIDDKSNIPGKTTIYPNYPNPFNAVTTIKYGLADGQHVTIEIYDLLGRRVAKIVDEDKPAGLYQAIWRAEEVPSGIYFYKINAGDYSKTRKMVLVK